jgi:hypothetical protein
LLEEIFVRETNRYAKQWFESHPNVKARSRTKMWMEVDTIEMKRFIGLTLLVGLVKVPRLQLYWSRDHMFSLPLFKAIMDRDRYILLLKFWHFANNEENENNRDRLYKIRALITQLNTKFEEVYIPSEYISLDESLLIWKGRLLFKQYVPMKRARYGIKQSVVAEDTGYVYRIKVYTGKEDQEATIFGNYELSNETEAKTKTDKLVIYMLSGMLNKGYKLFVDNYYSSQKLFTFLHNHGTNACGTIAKNRIPREVKITKIPKGESAAWRCDNLLCLKYHDRKEVHMLTTMHDESTTQVPLRSRRSANNFANKPNCIISYNKHMGGVDRVDQLLQPFNANRKTLKWYRKLVIHFL